MAAIRFEHIVKRFDGTMVLPDLDLTIKDREFFTFVGPSGCGKSTILSLIAGLELLSGGKLYFEDRCVNDLAPGERDVAMVFQNYALYPHLTVFENIAFPLRLRKLKRDSIDAAVREAAKTLGLDSLLHRKPRQLSGGQRQRVALARALVRKPRAFLMDEPLSNLDARLRIEMRAELKRIHNEFHITTVYVTHDQEEAMALADRIAVMHQGCVQQIGTPLEIYHRPANRFVGTFVGNPPMNVIKGNLLKDVPAFAPLFTTMSPEEVEFGVRPPDLVAKSYAESAALEVQVRAIEPVGRDTWVDGVWNQVLLRGLLSPGTEARPGDRLFFQVPLDSLHPFEKSSGKRLQQAPTN